MAQEPNAVEQAVSRALRENLERIQRTSEELHQAVADIVSACSSSKPTHALPPMLRAQGLAASIAASLEVMSRFVAMALQPAPRSPLETEIARVAGSVAVAEPAAHAQQRPVVQTQPAVPPPQRATAPVQHEPMAAEPVETEIELHAAPPKMAEPALEAGGDETEVEGDFNVSRLSTEEQELHRRANRVAKVSMQDIKMLNPEKVRLGRESKDLCIRLKDDIDKAHREYDRRFKPIMDHPVDYFYRWMVEILADGDPHALGEYPYAVPARQR